MLYYEIKCSTPYINEEGYYYVKIEEHNLQNIDDIASNYMYRYLIISKFISHCQYLCENKLPNVQFYNNIED